jgi:hypothetical protein
VSTQPAEIAFTPHGGGFGLQSEGVDLPSGLPA